MAKKQGKDRLTWRGWAASAVLLLAAGGALLWRGGDATKRVPPKADGRDARRVPRVTDADATSASLPSGADADARDARRVSRVTKRVPPGLSEEERAVWLRKARYEERKATDGRLKAFLAAQEPAPAMYRTGTEQVLDWIFFTKIGDLPPPPLPPIPAHELARIGELLDSVNAPGDGDDEETAERKQAVDNAKAVLKEYLAEGGTVQDFLDHYMRELALANQKKDAASVAIQEAIRSGDAEQAALFIEAVNRELEQEGINPVELTEGQKEELAEGLKGP